MRSQIQKCGQSLAVCIPQSIADEMGLSDTTSVELSLVEGRIIISPELVEPTPTLEELLAKVTDENKPAEVDWGGSVGREVW